jgi:hypothetical protein
MDEHSPKSENEPEFVRLKPAMAGRGLPVPPAILTVAMVCLLAGLAIGFGLPHGPTPPVPTSPPISPVPSRAATDSPTVIPSAPGPSIAPNTSPGDAPPPQGVPLTQVLDELERGSLGPRTDIIAARVVRLSEIPIPVAIPPDRWVWALTVRGSYINACGGTRFQPPEDPTNLPGPTSRIYSPCQATTELVVFDYQSGDFVYAVSPAPM